MAREKTYDSKCYDLAEFFLEDEPAGMNTEPARRALAIEVQETIESFIALLRFEAERHTVNAA
jgi:hypothetical protein